MISLLFSFLRVTLHNLSFAQYVCIYHKAESVTKSHLVIAIRSLENSNHYKRCHQHILHYI